MGSAETLEDVSLAFSLMVICSFFLFTFRTHTGRLFIREGTASLHGRPEPARESQNYGKIKAGPQSYVFEVVREPASAALTTWQLLFNKRPESWAHGYTFWNCPSLPRAAMFYTVD